MMDMNDTQSGSDDTNAEGEGVWSPDIEQCFREALLLFPPCGRRKHILQEEGGGKMYGRNELIARHIMMRTGKSRTRKQVSSHIQVLARRKAKAESTTTTTATSGPNSITGSVNLDSPMSNVSNRLTGQLLLAQSRPQSATGQQQHMPLDVWNDRPICTQKIRLVEFSAFIEYRCMTPPLVSMDHQHQHQTGGSGSIGDCHIPMDIDQQQLSQQQNDLGSNLEPPSRASLFQQHNVATTTNNTTTTTTTTTYPLASNHQVPAQFNQATYQPGDQLIGGAGSNAVGGQTHGQVNLDHQLNQSFGNLKSSLSTGGLQQQQQQQQQQQIGYPTSGNLMRHAYVSIDFSSPICSNTATNNNNNNQRQRQQVAGAGAEDSKVDRVCVSRVQDKFPEISGTEGFYQRGPAEAFYLIKFYVDLTNDYEFNIHDQNSFFGFTSRFETIEPLKDITCSTKVCSYGLQVVEKVEKIYGKFNTTNGRYSYDINRSPMCEFMIQFIKKLRRLPRSAQMNSVLENFTALQVITNNETSEILLCLAYVFEIPDEFNGDCGLSLTTSSADTNLEAAQILTQNQHQQQPNRCQVYKLTKD